MEPIGWQIKMLDSRHRFKAKHPCPRVWRARRPGHLFGHSMLAVMSPIKDPTGQSRYVDEYLGQADSASRKRDSTYFRQMSAKVNCCRTRADDHPVPAHAVIPTFHQFPSVTVALLHPQVYLDRSLQHLTPALALDVIGVARSVPSTGLPV